MKKGLRKKSFLGGTEGRDRTGTSVTSSVFETDASTDSATSATLKLRLQKYIFFQYKIQLL